jgi:glucose/arabinose dehydrogenase
MRTRRLLAITLVCTALVAGSCGGGGHKVATRKSSTTSSSTAETTTTADGSATSTSAAAGGASTTARPATTAKPVTTAAPVAPVAVKLTTVAGLNAPLAMAQAPGDDTIYVAEKGGRVRGVRNGQITGTVLDISSGVSNGGEQGLLGLAFSTTRAVMVVNYTDTSGNTNVDEYPFSGGHVTGPKRQLLYVAQPYANHNGGNVIFGPDGHLYVGMGDGGSGGDPQGHAQNPSDRLGKMLRIDTATNPATVQIWMIGLRNPWRWSFDKANGDLWIGDVGQDAWEEIDVAGAGTHGQNFGWNKREGKHPYNGGAEPAGAVDPVYDYHHDGGVCAVTGGYVYRGTRLTGWGGTYLFADECVGKVMALTRSGANVAVRDTGLSASQLASFGEDRAGELYVLSLAGGLYRIDPR